MTPRLIDAVNRFFQRWGEMLFAAALGFTGALLLIAFLDRSL